MILLLFFYYWLTIYCIWFIISVNLAEQSSALAVSNVESSDDLLEQLGWTIRGLVAAGLAQDADVQTHFVRKETSRLIATLDSLRHPKSALWITGSPGVGKSTSLFGWLTMTRNAQRGFVWIHSDIIGVYVVRRNRDGQTSTMFFRKKLSLDMLRTILLDIGDIDCIVLDGVHEEMREFFAKLVFHESKVIIACISDQTPRYNTEDRGMIGPYGEFVMNSWTIEEYLAAFQADSTVFAPNIASESDIEKAYYYSGGSMRLMRDTIPSSIKTLDEAFRSVSNFSDFLSGHIGDISPR